MQKPTFAQFACGYFAVFVATHVWVWTQYPSRYPFLTASVVNMVFVCINMIGVCFATGGYAPWREDDPKPPRPPRVSRMMTQPQSSKPIIIDSADWTGRR